MLGFNKLAVFLPCMCCFKMLTSFYKSLHTHDTLERREKHSKIGCNVTIWFQRIYPCRIYAPNPNQEPLEIEMLVFSGI